MRRTSVRRHLRRTTKGPTAVVRHSRTVPTTHGKREFPRRVSSKQKARDAAYEFRDKVESEKNLEGKMFLTIINRGEGEYTFKVKYGDVEQKMDYPPEYKKARSYYEQYETDEGD